MGFLMPYGLKNAHMAFLSSYSIKIALASSLMKNVLFNHLDGFVLVYLDAIVVYNQILEDHVSHLHKVLH